MPNDADAGPPTRDDEDFVIVEQLEVSNLSIIDQIFTKTIPSSYNHLTLVISVRFHAEAIDLGM
jgi:hypothetical protein